MLRIHNWKEVCPYCSSLLVSKTTEEYKDCSCGLSYSVSFRQRVAYSPKLPEKRLQLKNYQAYHDIAVLKTTTVIKYSDYVQPIKIEFRKIHDGLSAIKVGYNSQKFLKYGSTKIKACRKDLICGPRDKNRIVSGNSGGPLVACRDGFKGCRRIGVITGFRSVDAFVSTYTKRAFIRKYVNNPENVRAGAVRERTLNKVFVLELSFFIIMLISFYKHFLLRVLGK